MREKGEGISTVSGQRSEASAEQMFRREAPPVLFRIASGGDVMLGRGVEAIFLDEGPEGIFGGTAALVKSADLALLNLEGAITGDTESAAKKTYVFRFDPRVAPALKDAGFDAALIANNHAFDYGTTGFVDTMRYLGEAGLPVLGAGKNAEAAAAPFVKEGPSFLVKVFGLASFGKEMNGWDGLLFAADRETPGMLHAGKRGVELIEKQLDRNAFNIVYFHGGVEYAEHPDSETRALYTELIRAGADLVIGTHPHVEQGFEWVNGKPVFWSLGDYVFDEMDDTPGGDKGIFVVLSYAGKVLVHVDVYPVFMNGPRTIISPPEQLERFFRLTKMLAQ
jgi:poly-gamma-glutamate synthesis protein (capsule biosynthesis protein)